MEFYQKKYLCTDMPELSISGDFASNNGNNLLITFERCSGRPDCKPKAEIDEFIRGNYVVMLAN